MTGGRQPRDPAGRFAATNRPGPDVTLTPPGRDGRATVTDGVFRRPRSWGHVYNPVADGLARHASNIQVGDRVDLEGDPIVEEQSASPDRYDNNPQQVTNVTGKGGRVVITVESGESFSFSPDWEVNLG